MKAKIEMPELKGKSKLKFKIKYLIFILPLLIATIAITYAVLFSTSSIANRFESMKYDVTLEEEFYDDWGTKKVYIKNKEEATPVVLRVSYIEFWSKELDDKLLTLGSKIDEQDVVKKNWTNTWTNDFVLGSDGWYYYKKVLNAGSTIQILESIELDEDVLSSSKDADNYREYDYELTFSYETIQATEKAVKQLWNKDITINGDNIVW